MTISISTVMRPYSSSTINSTPSVKKEAVQATGGATTEGATVSISAEGLRQSTSVQNGAGNDISSYMHKNPDKGAVADFVKTMATVPDGALVSVTGAPGDPVHYSNTGEVVTSRSTDSFNSRAKEVLAGRQKIYSEEAAKGTDPADIYDKMVGYMKALPSDSFKAQVSGWGNLGSEVIPPAA